MKLRILVWLLLVFVMAFAVLSAESLLTQKSLAQKTLRLHVVANSDSEEDQAQKLRVRDAVLKASSTLTQECKTAEQAQKVLAEHLPALRAAAEETLRAEGSAAAVAVSIGTETFATRRYDTFTLPAGDYPSLRVRIGAAQGHNWWCVIFPTLCTAAGSDAVRQCAAVGGYTQDEAELVTGGESEYVLRFKALEWLQSIKRWFS